MRWVCIHFPDLPLEALAPPLDRPAAVYQQHGSRKLLLITNSLAKQRGLKAGLGVPGAQGLVPELVVLERKPDAEREAIEAAACWAYRFGSPVTLDPQRQALWVEVGHSADLFGGWRALAQQMRASESAPTYRKQWGVAPTLACAYLMATARGGFKRGILEIDQIIPAISPLPLDLLPLSSDQLDILRGAGLRQIKEVLAIANDALGRRLGKAALRALDQLVGRTSEVFESFELPASYRRRFEFSDPVETTEAMLFPLKMMLGEFSCYLYTRDAGAQAFTLRMVDSRKRETMHPVGLMSPTRDPARLLMVLKEKLDRIELESGVLELVLEADRFEEANVIQNDFFGSSNAVGQRFIELKERLIARLGPEAVRQIAVSADQRPEAATCEPSKQVIPGTRHPPRPLWLLREPRRITPRRLLTPPERIELGWFEGQDLPRDFYMAQDEQNRVCWVYRPPEGGDYFLCGYWQ